MKKHAVYCILSIMVVIVGSIFLISSTIMKTLLYPSKSALLIFSCSFICIGSALFAVHYKKYTCIRNLLHYNTPIIAKWTYMPQSSPILTQYCKEQKLNAIATAFLFLTFSIIFFLIFAYSGKSHILFLGYTLALVCVFIFIIALRFIGSYYELLAKTENSVVFGEDCIYFIDDLYGLNYSIYLLQNVNIYIGKENLLIFEYGLNDIDDEARCHLAIPIPIDKLDVAMKLKIYYRSIIHDYEN